MTDENKFEYTYTAPTESERREIESIRRQYENPQKRENKLQELRDLNKRVTAAPKIIGWILGIAGVLLFGWGMALVMEWNTLVVGIPVGIAGAAVAAAAYPVYKTILRRNKRKYGQQILDLSNRLLNNEEN